MMRRDVRIVAGCVSCGAFWVKGVTSGASCHAASSRLPSIVGDFDTRTAWRMGCSGQFAAWASGAMRKAMATKRLIMIVSDNVHGAAGAGQCRSSCPHRGVARASSLDHDAILHHERDVLGGVDVVEWVPWNSDDVRGLAGGERAQAVVARHVS